MAGGKFGWQPKKPGADPGGRPPYVPTEEHRKMVEAMCSVGVQQSEISLVLGIDPKTLRAHFREELDTAMVKANAKVAANLFKQATKDDPKAVSAAIFWAKCRMGWKEPVHMQHSGSVNLEFGKMNDDELRNFISTTASELGALSSGSEGNDQEEEEAGC